MEENNKNNIVVTKVGILFIVVLIVVLLWGISQETLAPDSILGRLTTTLAGKLLFGFAVVVPFYYLEKLLKKYGYEVFRDEEDSGP